MTDERTRSEYHLDLRSSATANSLDGLTPFADADSELLAELMLAAYRGTIDDEDETIVEAREAIGHYRALCLPEHSFVLMQNETAIAMSLVLIFNGVHYIDPVVVAAAHKRAGLGRQLVETCLASVQNAGIDTIGATITDGNEPSERLFARLGFTRVGSWPRPQQQ